MKRLLLSPIAAYQRWVSPSLPRRCRYEPTCSAYASEAIERFGAIRGSVLAAWRLLRCNPLSHGGFDPVRERFSLRGAKPIDPSVYHGDRVAR
ncbi:MAG TPA: membrane protein insertion efficiency factor YidD [Solirubrobacterales bacterium]